jgi:hypothetical protein
MGKIDSVARDLQETLRIDGNLADNPKDFDGVSKVVDKLKLASDMLASKDIEKASRALREARGAQEGIETEGYWQEAQGAIDEASQHLRDFVNDEDQEGLEQYLSSNPSYEKSLKADFLNEDAEYGAPVEEANEESDTLQASIAKLVESTEYTLGEIAEALAKATDENNEVIVNCLTESQDALEKLAGELATYLEGTSPTDEVEDETETETPIASPMASLAVLAGKPSRAEGNLAAVKAALSAEIRKQTLVAIGRTRDRK